MARQLNQAQCGQGAQIHFYLNSQTVGAVARLQPANGGGGQINWPAGGLYWEAEPGLGGVLGAARAAERWERWERVPRQFEILTATFG